MSEGNIRKLDLLYDEFNLVKGCLLTTKETFKCVPFKNQDIKNKINEIDKLLLKFSEN